MRFLGILFVVLYSFSSCKNSSRNKVDVSNVEVNFTMNRFENDFYNATENNLPKVKKKYPYLFPKSLTDSLVFSKINDKEEQQLYEETQKKYKEISFLKKQLVSLFKYVKYYNPKFVEPKVITMLSNIDYDNRVIYADSLLLISLDVYLGKEHSFYSDYPKYIKENNTSDHIIVDAANEIIETQITPEKNRSFISKMIFEGKKMYVLDRYLPEVSAKEKLGYSKEKMKWAFENEEQIWMYFIEKKILFSSESTLSKRFIDVAPFSKFYTSADNDSPGRIGLFMGWQIVSAFMLNNDVSLQELLNKNSEEIFKKSNYKPRK
jgi:gliding motility-associated lipoprotein GldB